MVCTRPHYCKDYLCRSRRSLSRTRRWGFRRVNEETIGVVRRQGNHVEGGVNFLELRCKTTRSTFAFGKHVFISSFAFLSVSHIFLRLSLFFSPSCCLSVFSLFLPPFLSSVPSPLCPLCLCVFFLCPFPFLVFLSSFRSQSRSYVHAHPQQHIRHCSLSPLHLTYLEPFPPNNLD